MTSPRLGPTLYRTSTVLEHRGGLLHAAAVLVVYISSLVSLILSRVMAEVNTGFIVATILVVIALLFYILYWNRVLAFLIELAFRVVLWNKGGSSTWIQIGAQTLSGLFHPPDASFRLFSLLPSCGSRSAQGFSLPFEQSDHQNSQGPIPLAILDSFPHYL